MQRKRVVITGVGLVSCYGADPDEFYYNLLEGNSGVDFIQDIDLSSLQTRFGARVKNFSAESVLEKKQARRIDLCIPYTISAGRDAVTRSKLDLTKLNKLRAGVIVGSGMGGMNTFLENAKTLVQKGPDRVSPFFVPFIITNMCGAMLAIDLGFKGPNYSISTACATSNNSMLAAAEHIRQGHADVMLTGGVEATMNQLCFAGFCALRAVSRGPVPQEASKPWDVKRDGFVIGEGAAVFVFEELEHALKRGAPILAEYMGGFTTCDAHHMTEPTPDGSDVARCIEEALKDGGLRPDQIDYINAHATSTPVGDLCEVRAIKKVFGPTLNRIKINATKSLIGHALGGAGALEMVAVLKAIETGMLHPTINLTEPEAELEDIDVVAGKAKRHVVEHAISNSFGFGGHNAVVVVSKFRENRG